MHGISVFCDDNGDAVTDKFGCEALKSFCINTHLEHHSRRLRFPKFDGHDACLRGEPIPHQCEERGRDRDREREGSNNQYDPNWAWLNDSRSDRYSKIASYPCRMWHLWCVPRQVLWFILLDRAGTFLLHIVQARELERERFDYTYGTTFAKEDTIQFGPKAWHRWRSWDCVSMC